MGIKKNCNKRYETQQKRKGSNRTVTEYRTYLFSHKYRFVSMKVQTSFNYFRSYLFMFEVQAHNSCKTWLSETLYLNTPLTFWRCGVHNQLCQTYRQLKLQCEGIISWTILKIKRNGYKKDFWICLDPGKRRKCHQGQRFQSESHRIFIQEMGIHVPSHFLDLSMLFLDKTLPKATNPKSNLTLFVA